MKKTTMNKTVGFIGGGRITRILLGGFKKAGKMPQQVVVSDTNVEILRTLQETFPEIRIAPNENAQPASCDLVFLALHPPVIKDSMKELAAALQSDAILMSLAPKFSLATLSSLLGGFQRIGRMIPNAPSLVNSGYNPLVFSEALRDAEKAELRDLFQTLGACPEVAENTLEAYAILTAMGPTYLWFQLYELQKLGTSFGLSEKSVQEAIQAMVNGMIHTMYSSDLSPKEVMDLIPVKPLGNEEEHIRSLYSTKLEALFSKLTT